MHFGDIGTGIAAARRTACAYRVDAAPVQLAAVSVHPVSGDVAASSEVRFVMLGEPRAESREPRAESREPRAESREPGHARAFRHPPHSHRAADAMGRADHARRERQSRPHAGSAHALASRPRRPAETASSHRSGFPARLARPGGAAACLLAAGLFLLVAAAPALAQTSIKLVGNTGQTSGLGSKGMDADVAQAFDTGSNSEGYKLTSVKASITGGANAPAYTVKVFLANDQTGHPTGDSLGTLNNPASLASTGTVTWTAAGGGIDLEPNEGYVVVWDLTTAPTSPPQWTAATSNNEDAGGQSGWAIADDRFQRGVSATAWSSDGGSLRIEVHGYAKQATIEPVRTARALVSNHGQPTSNANSSSFELDMAQAFTTGTDSGGFKLTRVDLQLSAGDGPTPPAYSVKIHRATAAGPGALAGTLTNPAALFSGVNRFTAPGGGIDLDSNTDYFVVIDVTGTANASEFSWFNTPTTGEDAGKAAGWSIDDGFWQKNPTWGSTSGRVNRISIHGHAKTATPPAKPGTPTVSAVSGSSSSLSVSWTAPAANGSAILGYGLRYFAGTSDPDDPADWVEGTESSGLPGPGAGTSATISGLAANTAYRVQVRAENAAGKGPWSDSRGATTNAASGTNNAPKLFEAKTGDTANSCQVKTDTSTPSERFGNAFAGAFVSLTPIANRQASGDTAEWPNSCTGSDRAVPVFDDRDAETLSYTLSYTPPENVRLWRDDVRIGESTNQGKTADRLFYRGVSAGSGSTDVRVDITATDPKGASASTHLIFVTGTFPDALGAPRFTGAVGLKGFETDAAIAPFTLPAAAGGDTRVRSHWIPEPYIYAVRGLPPGLSFDAKTRKVSGTPTQAGTYQVIYTADDFDGSYSRGGAQPTDSDTARQSFTVQVGQAPRINNVWVSSAPTHDSDGDGTFDTYVRGDKILFDVEFSQPVEVTGTPRIRMDLGADNNAHGDGSRRVVSLDSVLNGGMTLRFVYTVATGSNCGQATATGDCDGDGVWVQKNASHQVVFVPSGVTIANAETGEAAVLTKADLVQGGGLLPGGKNAKVNGGVTSHAGPVPSSATVNGRTVTVVFSEALNTSMNMGHLMMNLSLKGAGHVDRGNRNLYQHPSAISVSGSTLTLTLDTPALAGDTVTLNHEFVLSKQLRDTASPANNAPAFRDFPVTNNTGGAGGPLPVRASATGPVLRVVFDEALDETSAPAGSAFTVYARDRGRPARLIAGTGAVTVSGSTAAVLLEDAAHPHESMGLYYDPPADNPLRAKGGGGNAVTAITFFPVREKYDGVPPSVVNSAFSYVSGEAPVESKYFLYFNEALDTTSTPAAADFTVTVNGVAGTHTPSAVSVENNAVVLTVGAEPTSSNNTNDVLYTPGTNPIRDLAGNAAIGFKRSEAQANPGKPLLSIGRPVSVNWDILSINFIGQIDPTSVPAADAFSLHYPLRAGQMAADREEWGGTIVEVWGSFRAVNLRLSHPVFPCAGQNPLTLSYAKPGTNPIQSLDGTDADAFSHKAARNLVHGQCVRR